MSPEEMIAEAMLRHACTSWPDNHRPMTNIDCLAHDIAVELEKVTRLYWDCADAGKALHDEHLALRKRVAELEGAGWTGPKREHPFASGFKVEDD